MNKRLIELGAFVAILSLWIFAIITYIMSYDGLDAVDKVDWVLNVVLGLLVLMNLVTFSYRAFQRKKLGKMIYHLKPTLAFTSLSAVLLFGILLALYSTLHFGIGIRLSFSSLAMFIVLGAITFDSISQYLLGVGIGENGIVDGHNFYLWKDVFSYTYDQSNRILSFSVRHDRLFFKIKGKSEFYYDEDVKNGIDEILTLNIKKKGTYPQGCDG